MTNCGRLFPLRSAHFAPRWKARGVDWFAGISDWGAMAAGFRAFKAECEK